MTQSHSNSQMVAPPPTVSGAEDAAAPRPVEVETLGTLRKLLMLLTPAERRRGLLVLVMAVGMAFMELAGVASVLPFLAVLGNPAMVEQNQYLYLFYQWGGFTSVNSYLFVLGVGAFVVVVVSSLYRALTIWVLNRFTQMRSHSISLRLLKAYSARPYVFFLNRNSADLAKTILSESEQLVANTLRPITHILAYGLVAFTLVILLVVMDPAVAVAVAVTVALVYLLIYWSVRSILLRIGRDRMVYNQDRYKVTTELFGGIKDLKVLGRENSLVRRFERASSDYAALQASHLTLGQVPKHLIEAVGFGGILALALALMQTRQDLGEVLPILGLYALAAYRLLPAAQQIYVSLASLRVGTPVLNLICRDLQAGPQLSVQPAVAAPLDLKERIDFVNVGYRYPGGERAVLKAVDLSIPVRSTVAFVGTTGSGKTTTVDLVLGLLTATEGVIRIDGVPLDAGRMRSWQAGIGYVPQSIFLADASVAENIAFGIEPAVIDLEAVERAARIANLHDFVMNELPLGYATLVGERGIRLSGGQRQRIGIARALYHNPPVLVLDEATSALDNATEAAVMDAVRQLSGKKTIILVAHRLSTVEKADRIFVFEHGLVVAQGVFNELTQIKAFRRISGAKNSSTDMSDNSSIELMV